MRSDCMGRSVTAITAAPDGAQPEITAVYLRRYGLVSKSQSVPPPITRWKRTLPKYSGIVWWPTPDRVYGGQSGALEIVTCPYQNGGGLHADQAAVRVATSRAW